MKPGDRTAHHANEHEGKETSWKSRSARFKRGIDRLMLQGGIGENDPDNKQDEGADFAVREGAVADLAGVLVEEAVARDTRTEAVVGDNEKRVRCKVFVCRTAFDATNTRVDNLVGGITLNDARLHMLSWVRRIYAQANMSPLLVEGEVVAVGSGKVLDDGKIVPLEVKKGDKILFGKDYEPRLRRYANLEANRKRHNGRRI